MKARLSTDGGARGNPGPAAYGYVLEAEDGHVLDARGEAIGTATNNVAEYRGLVAGMQKAAELGVTELEVVSDSELLVNQMRGDYRVKNEALRVLREAANARERRLGCFRPTKGGCEVDPTTGVGVDPGNPELLEMGRPSHAARLSRTSRADAEVLPKVPDLRGYNPRPRGCSSVG